MKYVVETGGKTWAVEAVTPRGAALVAFATDPPGKPGMLTMVRPDDGATDDADAIYCDTERLLRECGYKVHG